MLWEILLCAVAAAAVLGLFWLLLAQLLLPLRAKDACLLLLGRDGGDGLEHSTRAYLLLKSAGALEGPLYLVDDGLSEDGLALAQQLTQLDDSIRLCPLSLLEAELQIQK